MDTCVARGCDSMSDMDWHRLIPRGSMENVFVSPNGRVYVGLCVKDSRRHSVRNAEGRRGCRLLCYDLDGNKRWSRPRLRALGILPDGTLIGMQPNGSLFKVAPTGHLMKDNKRITNLGTLVSTGGPPIVFVSLEQATILDANLNIQARFPWDKKSPRGDPVCVSEHLYWTDGDEILVCDYAGHTEVLAEVPFTALAEAAEAYERLTGIPVLETYQLSSIDDMGKQLMPCRVDANRIVPHKVGTEALKEWTRVWRLSVDEDRGLMFLSNAIGPHFVACLTLGGSLRWCEVFSRGCCAGPVYPLFDGRYVVSSGCGGIVSWFDREGSIFAQSKPFDLPGLGSAFDGRLEPAPDGRVFVNGGPGIVVLGPSGECLRIIAKDQYRCFGFRYHAGRNRLICWGWTAGWFGQRKEYIGAVAL